MKNLSKNLVNTLSKITNRDVSGLILVPGANMKYFTGFHTKPSERLTVALYNLDGDSALIVPKIDKEKAETTSSVDNIYSYTDEDGPLEIVKKVIDNLHLRGKLIGADGNISLCIMNVFDKPSLIVKFRDVSDILLCSRKVKESTEIEKIRNACTILSTTFTNIDLFIESGITEREASVRMVTELVRKGADDASCVVLSGPNTSIPHLESSSKRIKKNEVVVTDAWCTYGGYFADVTRTVFTGKPDIEKRNMYNIVKKAQKKSINAIQDGVRVDKVDRAARSIITMSGYGKYYTHRTGHGLGLDVHEGPYIQQGSESRLKRNMVVTIEPGIYIPHKFGIRLEDDIMVSLDCAEVLTDVPNDLLIIH